MKKLTCAIAVAAFACGSFFPDAAEAEQSTTRAQPRISHTDVRKI